MDKKTLVLGASLKPERYSNMAIRLLRRYGHTVFALGMREGNVAGVEIFKDKRKIDNLHTVTLYLNPRRQKEYYDYILELNPKRVIFNPGTENPELEHLCRMQNIETVENCTLVMLNSGLF